MRFSVTFQPFSPSVNPKSAFLLVQIIEKTRLFSHTHPCVSKLSFIRISHSFRFVKFFSQYRNSFFFSAKLSQNVHIFSWDLCYNNGKISSAKEFAL